MNKNYVMIIEGLCLLWCCVMYGTCCEESRDIVAEWSKALDLGSSLCWRGFKSHRCQLFFIYYDTYSICDDVS